MDATHSILRSAKSFLAGTLLSRLSGLLRDMALAISFGSAPEVSAFFVAYRLANLFRRLFGEGNLQAAFVPHYVSLKEEGGAFFRDTAYSMGILLLSAVVCFEMTLWGCRSFLNPDWQEIVDLTLWMVPGLFFICLYGLNSALLQCRGKYFIPAVAPVIFNFIWIAVVLLFPDIRFLAIAITLAFAGQWLATAFEGFRLLSFRQWLNPNLFSPEFRKLLKPLFLGIIGIGAVQLNSALDAIFARIADLKGPAFLWYAIRIQQLPLALFGVALSGALLPPLSREEDPIRRQTLLDAALRYSATLMLISTFGIFALGEVGVNLLFGHGDFTFDDVRKTTHCLWAYGVGLVPSAFVLILAASCYAGKNYRAPTVASLFAVGANMGLNALFVFGFGWGAISIAIATSLSSFLNAVVLSQGAFQRSFWLFFAKMSTLCAAAGAVVFALYIFWADSATRDPFLQASHVAIFTLVYVSILVVLAKWLGLQELFDLFRRNVSLSK